MIYHDDYFLMVSWQVEMQMAMDVKARPLTNRCITGCLRRAPIRFGQETLKL